MSELSKDQRKRRRRRRRIAGGVVGSLALISVVLLARGWRAFGKSAEGARLERMEASPQWADGHFTNPEPLWNDGWGMLREFVSASDQGSPETPPPVVTLDAHSFDDLPATGLRVTWLGHSTMLVELDGHRILTDPVWGDRTSPFPRLGPKRWYPPPIALDDLPKIDAVVISHDHYDHLDYPTIVAIRDWDTVFITPLGVGAHLSYWGVDEDKIIELDWWERTQVGSLGVVCTPARHASGRQLFDKDATLWGGYALIGDQHRVYFSGDTGMFPALREIGAELGPFDLTMIETGAYGQAWPDWHIGPEQAVRAHQIVRGRVMLPVHWGLFNLAYHGWTEPIERTQAAATEAGVRLATPMPGQSFEPEALPEFEVWWPTIEWRNAEAYPIVSRGIPDMGVGLTPE